MGTLPINILGTSFTIQANEDDDYLRKLLGYYERIVQEIKKSGILHDDKQVAIMSGIMLCDELYKEKSRIISSGSTTYSSTVEEEEVERKTLELIEKINRVL